MPPLSLQDLAQLEEQINRRATNLARQFQSENPELPFEKCYLVYKFLETPSYAIEAGLHSMMPQQEAKHYFHRVARQLHPDKNAHPLAKDAFQKLNTAIELVKSQVP